MRFGALDRGKYMDKRANPISAATRQGVEVIQHEGKMLCMIVRALPMPEATVFYTPDDLNLQVGKVVYAAKGKIAHHRHKPIRRSVVGTQEVLVVQKGRMILDIFADDLSLRSSQEMGPGDVVILVAGGHGFHFLEDTVLLEVKQGPYLGDGEKESF
jgi:hypothetical protein